MKRQHQENSIATTVPLYVARDDGTIQCALCAQACRLRDDQKGICGVRQRKGEEIVSLVYGRVVAEHIDPIEKKPLYHVLPGSLSYSIATRGCNFRCLHCQNASISQVARDADVTLSGVSRDPSQIVAAAEAGGCSSISYTYVEPTVFFEFAYDCCALAKARGLKNIFVSNGYMSDTVIDMLAPVLDAINIDLKSFRESFYNKVCGATLAPILSSIARFKELGVWVEVTTLVIPGKNDSEEELSEIASFLAGIDPTIPWHVSGFYPSYKMSDVSPTDAAKLTRARQIGLDRGLHHVYAGNRPGTGGENTLCPSCQEVVIERHGFHIMANRLQHGCCPHCNTPLPGIWR